MDSGRLFGQLPQYPPCSDSSFDSECSACIRNMADLNIDKRKGKKMMSEKIFGRREQKVLVQNKIARPCRINPMEENYDITNEVQKSLDEARKKASKISSNHNYVQFRDPEAEEIIEKRKRELEVRVEDAKDYGKYQRILEVKSHKAHVKNLEKKCRSLAKKNLQIKTANKLQQDRAFQILRDQRAQYLKKLQKMRQFSHNMMFEIQKGKIIDEKKNFKDYMSTCASQAQKHLQSIESKHQNTVFELRQMLEEVKKERQVNKVNNKLVIRQMEQQLKDDQKNFQDKFNSRVQTELQRSRAAKYKYGQKL